MKKGFVFITIIIIFSLSVNAQTIPVNSCAIRFSYDAAGNRTSRDYFCNNGLIAAKLDTASSFQVVDAIFPNPTTGRFKVTFSNKLDGATVYIMTSEGSIFFTSQFTGFVADFDISAKANGVYFVVIKKGIAKTVFKVVKQ